MAWILISARPHATRIGVAKRMEPDDPSSPQRSICCELDLYFSGSYIYAKDFGSADYHRRLNCLVWMSVSRRGILYGQPRRTSETLAPGCFGFIGIACNPSIRWPRAQREAARRSLDACRHCSVGWRGSCTVHRVMPLQETPHEQIGAPCVNLSYRKAG